MNGNAVLFNLQPYHPVSDTDVCLDDLITKHGFDLGAKRCHVDTERLRIIWERIVPDFFQYEVMRQHTPDILSHYAQQFIFDRSKVDFFTVYSDETGIVIYGEPAIFKFRRLFFGVLMDVLESPYGNTDMREKLVHTERLSDVIIGTEIERIYLVTFITPCTYYDYRE